MKTTLTALATLALVVGLNPSRAEASLGGTFGMNFNSINPFYVNYVTQPPGVTWTFQTTNLSAGGDTVININIQNANDPQGGLRSGQ